MQFKKANKGLRKSWQRNKMVSRLLEKNPRMIRGEALRMANEKVFGKKSASKF